MSDYMLQIKQLADNPRCRIYRQFIRTLAEDRNIRLTGCSYLFYFMALCANVWFRTTYRRIDGIVYTLYPGEDMFHINEAAALFRTHSRRKVIAIMDYLQKHNFITYSKLCRGKVVKFKIIDWAQSNTIPEYNAPCPTEDNFFRIPVARINELIGIGKGSAMDAALDLWLNSVYREERVKGSFACPVVYFRNNSGNPFVTYAELGERWGIPEKRAETILNALNDEGYITVIPLGQIGVVIYLRGYFSTMFTISDVMLDKDEIEMKLDFHMRTPCQISVAESVYDHIVSDEQLVVPKTEKYITKPYLRAIVTKMSSLLGAQGIACCSCTISNYKLVNLFPDNLYCNAVYELRIGCDNGSVHYRFELKIIPEKLNGRSGGNEEKLTEIK